MDNNTSFQRGQLAGTGTRVLAILGFIAILGVGMWGTVKIASAVPNAFSSIAAAVSSLTSIFVPAGETITLSAPSLTVNSGEAFMLSWEHSKKSVDGSYTFRYDCANGMYFTSPDVTGQSKTVYCNVPFNFLNSTNGIALTPVSSDNRFIDVKLYVDFTPNGASVATVTGSAVLTVINENQTTSPVITTPTTPTTPTQPTTPTTPTKPVTQTPGSQTSNTYLINGQVPPVSNPNGVVDLSARVIEIGVVDKATGVFTASSTPSRVPFGARIAVRFAVENKGTKTSPQFDFSVVLPTFPQNVFFSPMQQELGPGDRIEFTLAFDQFVDASSAEITINVDPSSRVMEQNKSNNIVKHMINVIR